MTITKHTLNASMVVDPYWSNVSDTPVFADGFQGSLSAWTPGTAATITKTFNDTTSRFEMQVGFANGSSPTSGQVSTTFATVVGKTYRVLVSAYSPDGYALGTQIVYAYANGSGTYITGSAGVPLTKAPQTLQAYMFVANATTTTLNLQVYSYGTSRSVVFQSVAVYEVAATTYLDLKPERAQVALDEARSPFVRAVIACPIPTNDVLDKIDPRKSPAPRAALALTQTDHESLKASDLTAMLAVSGATRTNLVPNPRPNTLGFWTYATPSGAAVVAASVLSDSAGLGPNALTGGMRSLVTSAGTIGLTISFSAAIAAGDTVLGSLYIRSSQAVTLTFAVGGTSTVNVTLVPNVWTRVSAALTYASSSSFTSLNIVTPSLPMDTRLDVAQALVEKVVSPTTPLGDYFDGSVGRVGSPAGFTSWTGSANASPSQKVFGAITAANLTAALVGYKASGLTDLFGDQFNASFDNTLNITRNLNLMIWDRALDYVAGTMTVTLTSDEMLLQDYARPSLDADYAPPVTTSLKTLVNWALSLARLGALDATSSDFTITSTDVIWNQGEDLWNFLNAFISNAGLRLWCDESRNWFLKAPYDGSTGTVTVNGLTALDDVLSRETWGDAVLIANQWTDPATGLTTTQYAGSMNPGFSRTFVQKNVSRAAPTTVGAGALLSRVNGRGRQVGAQGVSNYAVTPGFTANISTPTTTVPPVLVSSVSWSFPDDEMTVTTRDLP